MDDQHARRSACELQAGALHGRWCLQWLLVLASLFFCSSSILAAGVVAESAQHINANLFGDLFGVAGLKKDGHEVPWLLMAHVDFSFEQEAS